MTASPVETWFDADPFDAAFQDNPHPRLKRLREEQPVNLTPAGIWRLSRYSDCVRLLTQIRTGVRRSDGSFPFEELLPGGGKALFILQQDPPNHTRLRKLVSKAFTPRATELLRVETQTLVDDLINRIGRTESVDLISEFALPIPSALICNIMGIPLADREIFGEWTAHATHLLGAPLLPLETVEAGRRALTELHNYLEALIESRRYDLGSDVISDLIRAEADGDRLTSAELVAQCRGLLIAGYETTVGLIGNAVLALIHNPEQLALLQRTPVLIDQAVEEFLRFDGPIQLTSRYLREDATFDGVVIPEGSQVWAMLLAANRDPDQFRDPDAFDITRADNPHLAFGGGVHHCLGAHLARMQAAVALGTLVRRCRHIATGPEPPEWGRSLFRVLKRLPVSITLT